MGSTHTAVLLGYREDRTDRVCFRSTNAHLEAWKEINEVCPEANILPSSDIVKALPFIYVTAYFINLVLFL